MKGMTIKVAQKTYKQGAGQPKGCEKYEQNPGGKLQTAVTEKNQEVKVEQQEEKVFVQGQQDK